MIMILYISTLLNLRARALWRHWDAEDGASYHPAASVAFRCRASTFRLNMCLCRGGEEGASFDVLLLLLLQGSMPLALPLRRCSHCESHPP